MTLPYDGDIAAAQHIEFAGGTVEAAALLPSASFSANVSTCCRNSVTSSQAAVSGLPATLLILARLVLFCLFIGLGLRLGNLECCLEPEKERMLL